MLNDAIEVLEMFPNESSDARIFWDCLFFAVVLEISRCGSSYWYVVDVGLCNMRYFGSEDVSHVIVKDGNRICPSHR